MESVEVKFVGEAVEARGLAGGCILHSCLELLESKRNFESIPLVGLEAGEAIKEGREEGNIRRERTARINGLSGTRGGGMAAMKKCREERQNLRLNLSLGGEDGGGNSVTNRPEARGEASPALSSLVEETSFLIRE